MKKILSLVVLGLLFLSASGQELKTTISVHDPVMIRQGNTYYVFCTGTGIAVWSSDDRVHWKKEQQVFDKAPAWVIRQLPAFDNHVWAPDISFHQGIYYLYYAVSAFGKNTSSIGVAINTTLNTHDPAYKWVDQGKVIQSHPGIDNWNAIDPNLIEDRDGTAYLAFGSFWSGLKMVKMAPDRLHTDPIDTALISLASRQAEGRGTNLPAVDGNPVAAGGNAIEAPFIFKKGTYFYLFASIDYCCKGPGSTYKMIMGRSRQLRGPYTDMEGMPLMKGGGTLLLKPDKNWYGAGHNAVCTFDGADYLVFHGYDAQDQGKSKLRIEHLTWKDDWPVVTPDEPAASVNRDTLIQTHGNPLFTHKFTADPAAMVYKDQVYLYTGHDEAPRNVNGYQMHDWCCFSSPDMVNWTEHPVPLHITDFAWAKNDAWASQVIERNGKFYWYVAVEHGAIPGKAIGVAVSDSPSGPFKDARGSALVTNDMTTVAKHPWDDIDPTVMIDDDGQAWLFWGNGICYYAKLKPSMTELDGPIQSLKLPGYTEAPWIHKHKNWYYLSYASGFPEKISYAMSRSITGPWDFKGVLNELAGNSNTNHQAIIDFKGKSYFIYHNGALAADAGSFHRSVCIDYVYYNPDGTMKPIVMTSQGVGAVH